MDAGEDAEGSLIAPGGFEPPFSDPKSDVLPLDEGAAVLCDTNLVTARWWRQVVSFLLRRNLHGAPHLLQQRRVALLVCLW